MKRLLETQKKYQLLNNTQANSLEKKWGYGCVFRTISVILVFCSKNSAYFVRLHSIGTFCWHLKTHRKAHFRCDGHEKRKKRMAAENNERAAFCLTYKRPRFTNYLSIFVCDKVFFYDVRSHHHHQKVVLYMH